MHHSISRRFSWLNLLIIASVVIVTLASCSSEPDQPSYVEVQSRVLNSGDELPAMQGEAIFEVSGGTTGESATPVDKNILESLGTIKYSVNDPYENVTIEYEGVLLKTLFDQFGGEGSTEVAITAIDDYQQVIPRVDAEKWPIMLALKSNGAYAPKDNRGPSMIVYPYDQFPELDPTTYDPFWIWQIKNIRFN
jgi:hypothetical protein